MLVKSQICIIVFIIIFSGICEVSLCFSSGCERLCNHAVSLKLVSNVMQLYAAVDFSRRRFLDALFGAFSIKS